MKYLKTFALVYLLLPFGVFACDGDGQIDAVDSIGLGLISVSLFTLSFLFIHRFRGGRKKVVKLLWILIALSISLGSGLLVISQVFSKAC